MSVSPTVLIFGFGAFGRLMARALSPLLPVSVCDPSAAAQAEARSLGLPLAKPEEIGQFSIVILAVPVSALGDCLHGIAPYLRNGQTVMDVCSVKQGPAGLMRQILPQGVNILATHPMFGPQSMPADLAGGRIVLCPLRGEWQRIAAFLRKVLHLRVIVSTPEEHDRHAALTQGLTHLLARALAGFEPHPLIRTRSFDLLAEALGMVVHDAPEVFEAVTQGNSHVAAVRDQFARRLLHMDDGLQSTAA